MSRRTGCTLALALGMGLAGCQKTQPTAAAGDASATTLAAQAAVSQTLIENAVLHHRAAPAASDANATLTLTKPIFVKMMAGTAGAKDTLLSDDLKVEGSKIALVRFFSLIDKAPGNFAVVTR